MKFLVETSARHVHLSQEHLEILFGAGYELTKKKDLSQPGQYACEERVTIVGGKKHAPSALRPPSESPATSREAAHARSSDPRARSRSPRA